MKQDAVIRKEDFKNVYRKLETRVLFELREKINQSKRQSKHIDGKAIKDGICGYDELVIINDRLTFLDENGHHYSVFTVGLEELIDILNQ